MATAKKKKPVKAKKAKVAAKKPVKAKKKPVKAKKLAKAKAKKPVARAKPKPAPKPKVTPAPKTPPAPKPSSSSNGATQKTQVPPPVEATQTPPPPRPTPPAPPGPTLEAVLGHIRQRRGLPIPPSPLDTSLLTDVTAQTGLEPAEDLVLAWTWLADRDVFSPELLISTTAAARERTGKPELVAVRGDGEAFLVLDQTREGETWLTELHGFNTGASFALTSWIARQYLSAEERHALGFAS